MTSLDVAKRRESDAVSRSHSSDGGYQTSAGGSSESSAGGSCQWVDLALDGEVGQPGWQNYWNQLRARWHPVYLFGWMPTVGSYWDKTEEDYYVEEIPEVIEEVVVEERPEVVTDVIVKEIPEYTTCTILHPVEYSAVKYGSSSTIYGKASRERKRKSRGCCACLPCCTWCVCCWLLLALLLLAAAAVPLILHLLKPTEGKDGDTVGRVAMDVTLFNNGSFTEDVTNTSSRQHKTLDSQLHQEVKKVLEDRLKEGYYNDSKLKSTEYREGGVNIQYHLYFNVIKNARPSTGELRDIFLSLERDETNKELGILGLLKFFINTLRFSDGTHVAWRERDGFVFQNKTSPSGTDSKATPTVEPVDGKDHTQSHPIKEPVSVTSAPVTSSTVSTTESQHTTTELFVSTDRIAKPETTANYEPHHTDIDGQVPYSTKVREKMSTEGDLYVTDSVSPRSTLETESTEGPDKGTIADIDSAHSYNHKILLQDMKLLLFFIFNDNTLKTMIQPRGLIKSFNRDETYYSFLIEFLNLNESNNEPKDAFNTFFAAFYNRNSTESMRTAKYLFNQIKSDFSDMLTSSILMNLKNEIEGNTTHAHLLNNLSSADVFNITILSHENGYVKQNIGLDYLLQVITKMENSSTLDSSAHDDQSGNKLLSQSISKYLAPLRNVMRYLHLSRNDSKPADGIITKDHLLNVFGNKQAGSIHDPITSIVRNSLMSWNVTSKTSEKNDAQSHQFILDNLRSAGNLPNIFDGNILLDIFFNMQHIRKKILETGEYESETNDQPTKDSVRKQRLKSQAALFLHLLKNKAVTMKMIRIFPEQDLTHKQVTAMKSVYVLNSMLMRSKDVAEVGYMLMHADKILNGTLIQNISGAFFDKKVSEIIYSIEDGTQKQNVVQIVRLLQTWKLLEDAIEQVAKPSNLPQLYNRLSIWKMFYILHLMKSGIQKTDHSYKTTTTFVSDLETMPTFSEDLLISTTLETVPVSGTTDVFSTDVASSTYHHSTMNATPESIQSTSETFWTDSTTTASKGQIETNTHMPSVELTSQSQPYSETTAKIEEIYEANYSVIIKNMIQMLQYVKHDMPLKRSLQIKGNISMHQEDKKYLDFLIVFLPVTEYWSSYNLTNNLDERSYFNKAFNDVLDISEEKLHIGNLIHVLNLINNGTIYDLNTIFNNQGTNQAKWKEDDELIRWTVEELLLVLNMSIPEGISLEVFLNNMLTTLIGGQLSEEIFLEVLGLVRNVTSLPADNFNNIFNKSSVVANAKFDLWELLYITRLLKKGTFQEQFIPDKVFEKDVSSKEQLIRNLHVILNSLEHGYTNNTSVFGEFKHLTSDQIELLNLVYTLNMIPNGTCLKTSSFRGFNDTFPPLQRSRNLYELAYLLVILNSIQIPKLIHSFNQIPLDRNIYTVIESTEDQVQRKNLQDILHLIHSWSSFRDTNISSVIGDAVPLTDDSGSDRAFWDLLYSLHLIHNWRIIEESKNVISVVHTTSLPTNKTEELSLTTETEHISTAISSQSTIDGSISSYFDVSSVTLPTSSRLMSSPTEALRKSEHVSSSLGATEEITTTEDLQETTEVTTHLETEHISYMAVSTAKYLTQKRNQTTSLTSESTTSSKSEKSTAPLQSSTLTASVIFNETTDIPFETTTSYRGVKDMNRIKGKLDNIIHLLQVLANDNALKGYLRKNIGVKDNLNKTSFLEFLNLLLSIDKHDDRPNELISHYFVKHGTRDELASASVFNRSMGEYFNLTRDTFQLRDLIHIMNLAKNGTLFTVGSQVHNKTDSEDEPFSRILAQLMRFINETGIKDIGIGYTPVKSYSEGWNKTVDKFDMDTVSLILNLISKWSFPFGFTEETLNSPLWNDGGDETELWNLLIISRLMHNDMFKNTTIYDKDIKKYDSSQRKLIERIFLIFKYLENDIVNGTNLVTGIKNLTVEQLRFLNLIYALNTIQNETLFKALNARGFNNLPPLNRPRSVHELAYLLMILDNIQDRKPLQESHQILFDRDIDDAIESIDDSVQSRNMQEILYLMRTLNAFRNTNLSHVIGRDTIMTDDYENDRAFWNLLYLLHLTQNWRVTDQSENVILAEFTSTSPTFQTEEFPLPTESTTAESGKGITEVDSQTPSFYDDLTSISFESDDTTLSTTSWLMTGTVETFTDSKSILSTQENVTEQRAMIIESVSTTTEASEPISAKEHANTTAYSEAKSFNTMTASTDTTTIQVEPTSTSSRTLNETTESFISKSPSTHVKETNKTMDDIIYLLQLLANDNSLKSYLRNIGDTRETLNQTSFLEFLNRHLSVNYDAKRIDETFSNYFVNDKIRNELESASVFNRSIGEYFDLTNDTYDIGNFIHIMNMVRNGTIFTDSDRVKRITDSSEVEEAFRWILDMLLKARNETLKEVSGTGYISDKSLSATWNQSRFNIDTTSFISSLIPGWSSSIGFTGKTFNLSLFDMRGVGKGNDLWDLRFISHLMQTGMLKNKTVYDRDIENYDVSQKEFIEKLLLILDSFGNNFLSEADSIPEFKTLTKEQLELLNLIYFLNMVQNETVFKYSNESKFSDNQISSQRPRSLRELAYLLIILENIEEETLTLGSKGIVDKDIDHAVESVENALQRKNLQEILHLIRTWVIFKDRNIENIADRTAHPSEDSSTSGKFWKLLYVLHLIQNWRLTQEIKEDTPTKFTTSSILLQTEEIPKTTNITTVTTEQEITKIGSQSTAFQDYFTENTTTIEDITTIDKNVASTTEALTSAILDITETHSTNVMTTSTEQNMTTTSSVIDRTLTLLTASEPTIMLTVTEQEITEFDIERTTFQDNMTSTSFEMFDDTTIPITTQQTTESTDNYTESKSVRPTLAITNVTDTEVDTTVLQSSIATTDTKAETTTATVRPTEESKETTTVDYTTDLTEEWSSTIETATILPQTKAEITESAIESTTFQDDLTSTSDERLDDTTLPLTTKQIIPTIEASTDHDTVRSTLGTTNASSTPVLKSSATTTDVLGQTSTDIFQELTTTNDAHFSKTTTAMTEAETTLTTVNMTEDNKEVPTEEYTTSITDWSPETTDSETTLLETEPILTQIAIESTTFASDLTSTQNATDTLPGTSALKISYTTEDVPITIMTTDESPSTTFEGDLTSISLETLDDRALPSTTQQRTKSPEASTESETVISTFTATNATDTVLGTTIQERSSMPTDVSEQTSTEVIQELSTTNDDFFSTEAKSTLTTSSLTEESKAVTTVKYTTQSTDAFLITTNSVTVIPKSEPGRTEIDIESTTFQDDLTTTPYNVFDDTTLPITTRQTQSNETSSGSLIASSTLGTTNATDTLLSTTVLESSEMTTDVPEQTNTKAISTEELATTSDVHFSKTMTTEDESTLTTVSLTDESQSTTDTKTMLPETKSRITEIATESTTFQDDWNSTSDEIIDDTTLPMTTQLIPQLTEASTEIETVLSTLTTTNATDIWLETTVLESSMTTTDIPETILTTVSPTEESQKATSEKHTTHLTDESQSTTLAAINFTESEPASTEITIESITFQDDSTTTSIDVLNGTSHTSTIFWDDLTSTYIDSTQPTTSRQITNVTNTPTTSKPIVSTFATTHASEHTKNITPVTYTTYSSYNETEEEQIITETFTEQDISGIDSKTNTFQEDMTSTSVEIFDDTTIPFTETPTENKYVVSTIATTHASKSTTVPESAEKTTTETFLDYLTSISTDILDDMTLPTISSTHANDIHIQKSSSTGTDVPKALGTSENITKITTISETQATGAMTSSDSILTTKLSGELTTLTSTSHDDFLTLTSHESNDMTVPTMSFSITTQISTEINRAINTTRDDSDRRFVNFLRIILFMKRNRHTLNEMILRYLKEQRERDELDSPKHFNGSIGGIFDFTEGNIDIGDLLYVMNLVSNGTIYMDKAFEDVINRSRNLKDDRDISNGSLKDLLFILNKTMSTDSQFGNFTDGTIDGFNLSFWDEGGQMGDEFGMIDLLYISHLMKQGIVKQQQNMDNREADKHESTNGLLMKNLYLILQSLEKDVIPDSEINRVFAVKNVTTDQLEWLKLIYILNFVQNGTVLETSNMTGYIDTAQKPLQHIRSLQELAYLLVILNNIQEGTTFMKSNRALLHGDIDDAVNSVEDIVQRYNLQDILFLIRTWTDLKNKNENNQTIGSPGSMDNYRSFWDLLNMMHLIQNWRHQRDIADENVPTTHPTVSTSYDSLISTEAQIKLNPLTTDVAVTISGNTEETTMDLLKTDETSAFTLDPTQTSENVDDIIVTTPMTTENTASTFSIETVETSSAKTGPEQVTYAPQTTAVFTTVDPDYNYLWYLSMSDLKKLFPGGVDLNQPDEEWTKHTDHPENGTATDHRNVSTQGNSVKGEHIISAGQASDIKVVNTTSIEPSESNNAYKSVINKTLSALVDGIVPNTNSTNKRKVIHILLKSLQFDRNIVSREGTDNLAYVSNLLDDQINRTQLQYLLSIINLLHTAKNEQLLKLNAATEPTDWKALLQLLQNSTQYSSIGNVKPDKNYVSTNDTDFQNHLKYILNVISLNNETFSRAQVGNHTSASESNDGLNKIVQLLFKLSGADLLRNTSNPEEDTSSKQRSFARSLFFRYNKTQWQDEIRGLLMDKLQSAKLDGANFKLGDVMFIMNLLTYIANSDTITREESLPLLTWLDRWLHSDKFTFDSFISGTDLSFATNFSALFNTFRGVNPNAWLYILRQIENMTVSEIDTNTMNMGIDRYLLRDIFRLLDQPQNATMSKDLPLHTSDHWASSGSNATKDRPHLANTTRMYTSTAHEKLGYLPFLLIWNQSDPQSRDGIQSFMNMTDPNILINMLKLFGKKLVEGNDQSVKPQSDTITQRYNITTDLNKLLSFFDALQNITVRGGNADVITSPQTEAIDRKSDNSSKNDRLHMMSNASQIEDLVRLFYRLSGNTTIKADKTNSDNNLLKTLYQYLFLLRNGSITARSDLENMFSDGNYSSQQSMSTLLELMKMFGNGTLLSDRLEAGAGSVKPGEKIMWSLSETMPMRDIRTRVTTGNQSRVGEDTTLERGIIGNDTTGRSIIDGLHMMSNISRIEDMIKMFYRISGNTSAKTGEINSDNHLLKTLYQYLFLLRNGSSTAKTDLENMFSDGRFKNKPMSTLLALVKMFENGTTLSDRRTAEVDTVIPGDSVLWSVSEIMPLLVNRTRMTNDSHSNVKEDLSEERGAITDDITGRSVKDGIHMMSNASRIEDMIRLFYSISGNTTTKANKTNSDNLLKTLYQYLLLLRNGTDDSSANRSNLENMLSSVNMTTQSNINKMLKLIRMFGSGRLLPDKRKAEVGTDIPSERIVWSLSEILPLLMNGTRMTKESRIGEDTVVDQGPVADNAAEKRGNDKTDTREAGTDTIPTPTGDLHMYQGDTNGSEIEPSDATRVWGMVEANRPLTLVWEMNHVTGWEQVRLVRRFSNGTVEHIGTVSASDLVPRGSTGSLRISRRSRFHDDILEVVVALAMFTCKDEASYNINVTFASGATMWRQDQIFVYGQAVARLVTPPDLFEADGLGGVQCHATLGYPERELYFRLQTQTDSKPRLLIVDPSAYNVTAPAPCDREVTVTLKDVLEPGTKFDRAVVQCGLLARPRPGPPPPQGRWVASSPTVIRIIPDSVCPDDQSRVPHPFSRCNFIDCRHKMVMVCPDNTCFSPALGYCSPLTT